MNEALRDWVTNVDDTYYLIGTAAGPHPYPAMVRDFQSVIGEETRAQMLEAEGRLPDAVVACVGGGSNAIGLFHPFLADEGVRLIGVEAAGPRPGQRPARRVAQRRPPGRAARQQDLSAAGRRRPDPRGPLDLGRPRLSGHRPRARLAARRRPRRTICRPPTTRRWPPSGCCAGWKASSRRWNRAHALARLPRRRARARQGRDHRAATSPAAATRTWPPSPPPGTRDLTVGSRLDARFAALRPRAAPPSSPMSWPAIRTPRPRSRS